MIKFPFSCPHISIKEQSDLSHDLFSSNILHGDVHRYAYSERVCIFSVDSQTHKQVTGGPQHKTSKRIHMQIMCAAFFVPASLSLSHLIIWHEEFQYNAGGIECIYN